VLVDGPLREAAKDILSGGPGNDFIAVFNRSARRDIVTCGSGFDRVFAYKKDLVADDCEVVAISAAAQEELFQNLEETGFFDRFFSGLPPFPGG
jgi:hypothetical protein